MKLGWNLGWAPLCDEAGEDGADGGGGLSESDLVPDTDSGGGDSQDAGDSGGLELGAATSAEPDDPYRYVFDAAREHGLDLSTKYQSGRDAIAGLINAQRLVGRRDQDAELGRRLKPYAPQIEQFIQERLHPQQPAPQAEESPFDIPQLPPQVLRYVGRDDAGQLVISENAPPAVREAFSRWSQKREDFAYNLTTNPREALVNPLREQLRQEVLGEVQQLIEHRERQARSQQVDQAVLREVSPWLWQTDAQGRRIMGIDQHGNEAPLYTQEGAAYANAIRMLHSGGMSDTAAMHQVALQMIGGPPGQATTREAQRPAQKIPPGGKATKSRSAKPLENTEGMSLRDILQSEGWDLNDE